MHKYILELEIESEYPPSHAELEEASRAAARNIPGGMCKKWALRGSSPEREENAVNVQKA